LYVDDTDATTKLHVVAKNVQQNIAISSKAKKNDAILRDGKQSMKSNLDMENDITKVKKKLLV